MSGISEDRLPFAARQVVQLRQAADDNGQRLLGDLIELAMWTGGCLDELWQLTVKDVALFPADNPAIRFIVFGRDRPRRAVPVHTDFVPGLTILCATSTDGYIAERSPGGDPARIEAQFDSLRARLGFTDGHGFHSIRRTVETQMRQADVDGAIVADILGMPDQPAGRPENTARITDRQEAIETLAYPLGDFRPRPPR